MRIIRNVYKYLVIMVVLSVVLSSCYSVRVKEYYSNVDNFITVTAELNYIKYGDDNSSLYLGFEDLSKEFSDNVFKIVGENFKIVQQNNFNEKVILGEEVTFITAPKYFGDGYVMPIVSIYVGDEVLLDFEQGYENFISWLETQ